MSPVHETLGHLERSVLEYIAERGPVTVREVAAHFEETTGRARTTVLTVMERLRKKGFLKRRKVAGLQRYVSTVSRPDLLRQIVGDFVENVLGGRVSPFVAYLSETSKLSNEEIRNLEEVLKQIETRERRATP
jgi:predicted transcriptional regulator